MPRLSKNVIFLVAFCLVLGVATVILEAGKPIKVENCTNGRDDDKDTLVDCADLDDCSAHPACTGCEITENPEVTCDDGIDNDCDGDTDAADGDCTPADTIRYILTLEAGAWDPTTLDLLVAKCGKRTLPAGCPDGEFNAWFGMNDDYTPCAEFEFALAGPDTILGTGDDIVINSCVPGDPNRSGLNFYFDRIGGEVTFQLWMRDVDWKPYFTSPGMPVTEVRNEDCTQISLEFNNSYTVYSQKGKREVGTVALGVLHLVKDPTPEVLDDCDTDGDCRSIPCYCGHLEDDSCSPLIPVLP